MGLEQTGEIWKIWGRILVLGKWTDSSSVTPPSTDWDGMVRRWEHTWESGEIEESRKEKVKVSLLDMMTWRYRQAIQRERFGRQVEETDCSWRGIRVKRWTCEKEEAHDETLMNALNFREDEPSEETEIQLAGLEVLGEGWEEWGGIWRWAYVRIQVKQQRALRL